MPRTTRTFVAVAIPDVLGAKLARLQGLLAPEVPGTRWSATPPFHVTLSFLGDVADADLKGACEAVAGASMASGPFDLRVEGLGAFPDPKRPRVLWVGLTGPGLAALSDLRARVAKAVTAAVGVPDDPRFSPHVTLGRIRYDRRSPLDLTPLLKHYRTWSAGSFAVTEVVTFASTLTPDGPTYARLARAPLGGEDVREKSPFPSESSPSRPAGSPASEEDEAP